MYITGESYAGIYIPMLMQQIDLNPLQAPAMNLIGAAVSAYYLSVCLCGGGEYCMHSYIDICLYLSVYINDYL